MYINKAISENLNVQHVCKLLYFFVYVYADVYMYIHMYTYMRVYIGICMQPALGTYPFISILPFKPVKSAKLPNWLRSWGEGVP